MRLHDLRHSCVTLLLTCRPRTVSLRTDLCTVSPAARRRAERSIDAIGMTPSDPPTLLIDEADTIFGPKAGDNEDLRGLLNAGHQRGRPTLRYDAGSRTVEKIQTFAMAALAGIGTCPTPSRTAPPSSACAAARPARPSSPTGYAATARNSKTLRTELHAWITAHLDALTNAVPAMPLEDRAADTWEPLIALADLAGGKWPALARQAALSLLADREESSEVPLKVRLLMDCRTAFGAAQALPSAVLVTRLRADEEAPWADLAGAGLTVRRLAAMLREYDITPTNKRWQDGTQSKGYARDDFADAWSRYCPPVPENGSEEEPVPNRPNRPLAGHAGNGSIPWDGSSVPVKTSVPGLTCEGTVGTDREVGR